MDPDGFRDRNHRYSYLVACENAATASPRTPSAWLPLDITSIASRVTTRRNVRDIRVWSALLDEGFGVVAARLTERGERGDYARETAPSFGGLPGPVRARLSREAREPLPSIVPVALIA